MSDFKQFSKQLTAHLNNIFASAKRLYVTDVDRDQLWNLYLDSFPEGENEIYKTNREHDCSTCRHFVKRIGPVVAIIDGELTSVWDFVPTEAAYQPSVKAMRDLIHASTITGVFMSKDLQFGHEYNYDDDNNRWEHMHITLPKTLAWPRAGVEIGTAVSLLNSEYDVFKRTVETLSPGSIDVALDLIADNNLPRGEEWKGPLEVLRACTVEYKDLHPDARNVWLWAKAAELGPGITKVRNHSIGVLLQDLTEGMDLDQAVKRYEKIVAGDSYKRPKPIFTAKMREDAKKKAQDLGFYPSLQRRHANLSDVTLPNLLFANRDAQKRILEPDAFDALATQKTGIVNPATFRDAKTMAIQEFIDNVLPRAERLEVLVEDQHFSNLVSVIGPQDKAAPTMFKWNNPYCWAFRGNYADSVKELVRSKGGNVEGVMRFTLIWNDKDDWDQNDLDAHCMPPDRVRIYFQYMKHSKTQGKLDVDNRHPSKGEVAVENIAFPTLQQLLPGDYEFMVNCWAHRGGRSGFRAQLDLLGQVYEFSYDQNIKQDEFVHVVTVNVNERKELTIKKAMTSKTASRTVWGVNSNMFVPVTTVMYSPNYWDNQNGAGHRHVFFTLAGCLCDETLNGFYNEFLVNDLNEHRKVFEALGSYMKVEPTDDQLSGLGFSTTKRNEVVVRVSGATERVLRLIF